MRWIGLFLICAALGLVGSRDCCADPDGTQYSTPNGWKVRAGLSAVKTRVVLGEPAWVTFGIKNENKTDLHLMTSLGMTAGGRTADFNLVVTRVGSKEPLPLANTGPGVGSLAQRERIEAGQSYAHPLFVPLWAELDRPGRYLVSCTKRLVLQSSPDAAAKTHVVETSSQVEIEVLPYDAKAMGAVIDALGRRLVGPADRWERAIHSLQKIHDARVVPWWKRAIDTGRRDLLWAAARGLHRLADPAATRQLTRLSKLTAKDISDPIDADHAPRAAAAVRWHVAAWLQLSPHAAAHKLLRAMHTDPMPGVRLKVVDGLERSSDAASTAVLEKLAKDPDAKVRARAQAALDRRKR